MYLLYLDDSGSVKNVQDRYVILAGISVYEQAPYFLSNKLDTLAKKIFPDNFTDVEFHGTDIFGGKKAWRKIDKAVRIDIYKQALSIIASAGNSVRLFGAVIDKRVLAKGEPSKDGMEYAFEQLCSRFDLYLKRLHHGNDKKQQGQRGLIIVDKSSYETSLQGLARAFREKGHTWGVTRNISEVPLFVDSKATRLIQYADMVAYALRRKYEDGDHYYMDKIENKFDYEGGINHGLLHYTARDTGCDCISCVTKTVRQRIPSNTP